MRYLCSILAVASVCLAGELKLGKPLTLKQPRTVSETLAGADNLAGKIVQVKGKVSEVCQMMGCWMNLIDTGSGQSIRVKVNDGEIVFPKDAAGRMAIAEGTLTKLELTRDLAVTQARHEAEEAGRKFDPKSVKGGVVSYQIQGTGAVLLAE